MGDCSASRWWILTFLTQQYKLMFVADRSSSEDPRLSVTGDLYLLSLFKDYAFHQVRPACRSRSLVLSPLCCV
jgi:hypothetical protein